MISIIKPQSHIQIHRRELNGSSQNILEDVADNIFNPDPYMQQGGDMVRTAGSTL